MAGFHAFIPIGFSQYAGSGDRSVFPIPTDDTMVRYILVADKTIAVDQQQGWLDE